MESITLRELAAYLPYGVRYKDSYAGDISTRILNGNSIEHWKCGHIKPLILHLRPLSDLTKEIEVNGEMCIPIDWFEKNVNKTISFFQAMNLNYSLNIDIETENYAQTIDLYNGYLVIQKLLEWHFDCFNLIGRGLAIDLNSI